ncbi:olfactory receptor 5V1-like [Gopherus flavomarginatus]|uniref:olfactory receptor 5V1-like n=1 Tax=Gopherus flavomarginatus TaxID=286002 RepID=UPI0021CC37A4|nr:olfactory receptor 5V1-like [Gopherus flavomarginatus]
MGNQTKVTKFILLGLSSDPPMQIFLFLVLVVIYVITLIVNVVIILVIRADPHLHIPMYFFLSYLSFVTICYSSAIILKMLVIFLDENKTISADGCFAQIFFILLPDGAEIFILPAMAYDCYAAICDPLRYMEPMSKGICVLLVSGAWVIGFINAQLNTGFALRLPICGLNQTSHFSCELPPQLHLSCADTFTNQVVLLTSAVILGSSSFLFTLISYIHIISAILRIQSAQGRRKAFSTCSSHLIVVGLWYLTGSFQYTKPSSVSSVALDEMFSVQYNILTPMLNPIIYSLKKEEVKRVLGKILGTWKFLK